MHTYSHYSENPLELLLVIAAPQLLCDPQEKLHEEQYLHPEYVNNLMTSHYQCIKIFVVGLTVCDGCGRGCNEFAGRVQNHHVRFSFHRNGFLEIVKAAAGRDTLHCRLREGCHCGRLPLH